MTGLKCYLRGEHYLMYEQACPIRYLYSVTSEVHGVYGLRLNNDQSNKLE